MPRAARQSAPLSMIADPANYLAPVVKLLHAEWPDNRVINIVCHGHSVPSGYFVTPVVDTFNAYPHLLHRGLKEKFPHAVLNVIVTGIGGETSEQGAAHFETDVLTHRPDAVTIDYALNDRSIGLERSRASWLSMVKAAESRGIPVILLTPTGDLAADLDDSGDPLNLHAGQIRALAAENGVGLADSLAAVKRHIAAGGPLGTLMSQGNHPNRAGHEMVAGELLRWFPA